MPPVKGQMFKYSEADMEAAIKDCRRGVPTATAARRFGVPRVTLLNKVKGKTPIRRKMGRNCYMTEKFEEILVTWAKAMVKQGFPIGKDNLQDSVKKIVDDLEITTPFKNGRPGKKWYCSFLKRHPDLVTRQPQNLTASRASVTTCQINNWFQEVSNYLNSNNYTDILNEPKRVFNMDETAFFLNPKGTKVLAAKGERSVYQNINTNEKECFTVLLGGNAAGDVLPPMVVFKYERIPRELSTSVPKKWGVGRSDNGWMTRETFYEYISNIFHTWLGDNNIPRPVIVFIDGHTSHLSYHVSKFCSENGIILIALFPNATHLLQPMDVAVFRSLKGSWKAAVHSWRLENIDSPILRKVNFCPLLNKVLTATLTPTIFQNGFRKCGLVPWNPDEVCRILEPSNNQSIELSELQKMAKIKELEMGKKFLEKYINIKKIAEFKNCETWIGPKEDTELFKFYKNVDKSLKDLTSPNTQLETESDSAIASIFINENNTDATSNSLNEDLQIQLPHNDSLPLDLDEGNITLDNLTDNFKTPVIRTEHNSDSITIIADSLVMPSTSRLSQSLSHNMGEIILSPFKTPVKRTENNSDNTTISADPFAMPSTSRLSQNLSHNMGEIILSPFKTPVKRTEHNGDSTTISAGPLVMPSTSQFSQRLSHNMVEIIPSPFKRALFWPTPKDNPKKRMKEKIPSVVTSMQWQQYYENKDRKKNEMEEEKRRRLEVRKIKKEKTATRKHKASYLEKNKITQGD